MWVDITQFESDWGNRNFNFELKKEIVNHRYMTLAYTDVLISSDSLFELQKRINFIFDIVIVIQSHHNSNIHIGLFLPCLIYAPYFDPHLNCTKVISKTKMRGWKQDQFGRKILSLNF